MDENQRLTMMAMADHLQYNVTDPEFDMNVWSKPTDCGTIGCAIGHTVHLIHGLELRTPQGTYAVPGTFPVAPRPGKKDLHSTRALAHALGLTHVEACWLFYPADEMPDMEQYVTREEVYTRLRGFAKGELECPLG